MSFMDNCYLLPTVTLRDDGALNRQIAPASEHVPVISMRLPIKHDKKHKIHLQCPSV